MSLLQRIAAIFLFLVSILCYAAAFPPFELASLAWVAPVIWMFYLPGWSARRRFWVMVAVGYLGSAMVVGWLTALFSNLALGLWLVPGLYFGLWGASVGIFAEKGWQRIVWPPVAWVALEYFRCELAPHAFSFGGLGYSQSAWAGFSIASGIGVYGVSGLMILCGAFISEIWRHRKEYPMALRFGTIGLIIVAMVAAMIPTISNVEAAQQLGTALLQQTRQDDDFGARESMPVRRVQADLIVWPELIFISDPSLDESAWFVDLMKQDAAQATWGVLFGGIHFNTKDKVRPAPYTNSVFFMNPAGEIVARAGKNQPVQLMTDGVPAPGVVVMDVGDNGSGLRMGVGVCYDGCFQRFSRRMVARGADFLVFPTMNLESWGKTQHLQHQRMFQMRAAETGRTVLTAAVSGPTFAAAPGGAIAAKPAQFHITKTVPAPIMVPRQTLFNRGGWLFGPLMLAVFVCGAAWKLIVKMKGLKRRKRNRQ